MPPRRSAASGDFEIPVSWLSTFDKSRRERSFRVSHRQASMLLSALLVAAVGLYHAQFLAVGSLRHSDEFHTLDRSSSVLTHGDWTTIFSNHLPAFTKPPLQYWMSAGLLQAGLSPQVATRLPSFLFAIGVLALTGALAHWFVPDRPWAAPISIVLLSSSTAFWSSAISALLDMGSVFFAYLALIATMLALKRPRWWYLAAAACALGALQKVPVALVFAAAPIIAEGLTRPRAAGMPDATAAPSLATDHFRIALALVALGVLFWPVLQFVNYGGGSLRVAYLDQMVDRFMPFADGPGDTNPPLYSLVTNGEPVPRLLGALALFWLPWGTGRRDLWFPAVLFTIFVVTMGTASGAVSPRYTLTFLPMLMAGLSAALVTLISQPLSLWIAVVMFSLAGSGPLKSSGKLNLAAGSIEKFFPFFRGVSARVQPHVTLILCVTGDGSKRLYPGALSIYASGGKPFYPIAKSEGLQRLAASKATGGPYRGICADAAMAQLSPRLINFEVVEKFGGYTHWRADGVEPE
jgi:4-amino-4-deoxy-L-arabinose transferase-like glycosyltransferase